MNQSVTRSKRDRLAKISQLRQLSRTKLYVCVQCELAKWAREGSIADSLSKAREYASEGVVKKKKNDFAAREK